MRINRIVRDVFVILVIMHVLAFAVAICSGGSVDECLDATCRIGTGTGCAFERSQGNVYILTCGHVVGSARIINCEFWYRGHLSRPFRGTVLASKDIPACDAAVVAITEKQFGGILPGVIPLAPRGFKLVAGDTLISAGCARTAWATGWKGHLLKQVGGDFHFTPAPEGGRSGSAVLDESGRYIVGVIKIQAKEHTGRMWGIATGADAIYGYLGPMLRKTQCQPGGCFPIPWRHSPSPQPWRPSPSPQPYRPPLQQPDNGTPWPTLPERFRQVPPEVIPGKPADPPEALPPPPRVDTETVVAELRAEVESLRIKLEAITLKVGPPGPPGPPGKNADCAAVLTELAALRAEVKALTERVNQPITFVTIKNGEIMEVEPVYLGGRLEFNLLRVE